MGHPWLRLRIGLTIWNLIGRVLSGDMWLKNLRATIFWFGMTNEEMAFQIGTLKTSRSKPLSRTWRLSSTRWAWSVFLFWGFPREAPSRLLMQFVIPRECLSLFSMALTPEGGPNAEHLR